MPVAYVVAGVTGSAQMVLDDVQQLGYEQVPVWDGPTYLYTIYRVHIRGTYNPSTFAWDLFPIDADPPLRPGPIVGALPPTSNTAVRHFLMQPRGTLVYNIGGVAVAPGLAGIVGGIEALRSPTDVVDDFVMDAKNGPIPLHCNVVEVRGTKTFLVDWAIETYVNECYLFKESQSLSALLSQRWTMQEDLDQDFFATRTIIGHAIFRSDRLDALGANPDDYRAWLFHAVPPNFQRNVQQVIASEDGTRLDYVLVDREKPFNYTPSVVARGVTRIEAFYTNGFSRRLGTEETLIRGLQVAGEAILLGPLGAATDPAIGLREAIHLGFREFEIGLDSVPRFSQRVVCRVWGNRASTRAVLYSVAIQVFSSKIGNDPLQVGSGSVDVTEDLMGKFVELSGVVTLGPIDSGFKAGGICLALPAVGLDLVAGVTQNDGALQPAPVLGFAREVLQTTVANVLAGNCGLTPEPTLPPNFVTRTP